MSRNLTVRALSSTLGQSRNWDPAPYQWRGQPGWDPAEVGRRVKAGPGSKTRQNRIERLARFTDLRAAGVSITDAAAQLGMAARTARDYESVRLRGDR